jgi:hypothetical protein
MGLLREISSKYKTVSVIGMAKNAGKTTALNYLIAEADDEGLCLGVTSTGRDGETQDLVTGTDKPRVYLTEGALVTTPSKLYELSDAELEILQVTGHSTPVGQIMICRVASYGSVQVAGPLSAAGQKDVCERMASLGAELALIDGAIDRKAVAAPGASDAVILATGAALSRSMAAVAEETAHTVELYSLPELGAGALRDGIIEAQGADRVVTFGGGGAKVSEMKTGLAAGSLINEEIGRGAECVFLPGALTKSVTAALSAENLRKAAFVVTDPTKVFLDRAAWKRLKKGGFSVFVLAGVEIAAITVNPWSPEGYSFDSEALVASIRPLVGGIPVVDMKRGFMVNDRGAHQ